MADKLQELLVKWRADPVAWVVDLLGVQPRPWQADVLRAYMTEKRISIVSCHGSGKSCLSSWLILYHHMTRYPAKTVVTGAAFDQLKNTLWAEMGAWFNKLPSFFKDQFELTAEMLRSRANPASSFAALRTASTPEAMAGFHSENTLAVLDEASGVEDSIFEALSGVMTEPNARTVLFGNPTRASGMLYRSHHDLKHLYYTKQISAFDCPWIPEEWTATQAAIYGEDSNAYRIRVLGAFPTEDQDSLIPLELINAASYRDVDSRGNPILWGVDVSGGTGADKSVLCKRQGPAVLEPLKAWNDRDPVQLARLIIDDYESTPRDYRPSWILVDSIGVGAGTVGVLKEHGLPVRGINVAESAALKDRYARLRDEIWFRLRAWFETRAVSIPRQDQLIAELAAPRYIELASGKAQVESKSDMRRRGLKSPDYADALAITFAITDAQAARRPMGVSSQPFMAQTSFNPFA